MLDSPMSPVLAAAAPSMPSVVLLDRLGRPAGTAPKIGVHDRSTPLHLAFSCYVVDERGRLLLTRRAAHKRTWPSTWSNACCGHPQPGETLRQAVSRHLRDELGVTASRLAVALPDFAYRAVMDDGTVEHELCPVVVATVVGSIALDPAEADGSAWVDWPVLVARAGHAPATLSPWSVRQIAALATTIGDPGTWLAARPPVVPPRPTSAHAPAGDAALLDPFGPSFDQRLTEVIGERAAQLAALDPLSEVLATVLGDLSGRSAKRVRPAFVHWGHVAGGGTIGSAALLDLAVAMELLHTFALVHDDVIDRSPVRRGGPSVHAGFADVGCGAAGSDWFGTSAAIVAGDLAFVWADELLDAACAAAPDAQALRSSFHRLRIEVIAGQYLDLHHALDAARVQPTAADVLRVALLKSGRYTITRPLELGARLAGADDSGIVPLLAYGDAAGVAFQLRDDVLGVFGDSTATGKDALSDLREGKRTLLVVRAFELADRAARAALAGHLGDPDLDEDGAARCRQIIADCGALASVEARIAAEAHAAEDALVDVADPARDALAGLVGLLAGRPS